MKFTVKYNKRYGSWGIYRGSKLIGSDSTKAKAEEGVKFYKKYFRGNVSEDEASERYHREVKESIMKEKQKEQYDPLGIQDELKRMGY